MTGRWRFEDPAAAARIDDAAGDAQTFGATRALDWIAAHATFFNAHRPILLSRAPGRFDVMGGFADYSGSLVLEMPIAGATWIAAQETDEAALVVESDGATEVGGDRTVTLALDALVPGTNAGPLEYAAARALLGAEPRRAWAAYAAGAAVVLHRACGRRLAHGVRMLVRSDVPTGKGLSSSAALEVAALEVLSVLAGASVQEREAALLAQTIENAVVGAPCGVMDQMTAVSGRRDHLIEILCQPAEPRAQVPLPAALEIHGIDSGVRHQVSGDAYGDARVAAFMGYRIVAELAGLTARPAGPGRVTVDDDRFGGYLANVPVEEWQSRYRDQVPETLDGQTFLARYGGSTDTATTIDPGRRYPVRACTQHPIEEHRRVARFRDLLLTGGTAVDELGALMRRSHLGYNACGLGSPATDRLVELVRAAGPAAGLYGAKITGGGSGGTVAVLARRGSGAALAAVASAYAREQRGPHARPADTFTGSSSGSRAVGVCRLLPGD